MTTGSADPELPPDATGSKTCGSCHQLRLTSNFPTKGYHTAKDGRRTTYRGSNCRKCIREQKKRDHICLMCNRASEPGQHHCRKHLQLMSDSVKRRKSKDKIAAFTHYGQKCAYCADSRQLFLTIDHINNDGAVHRRNLRTGKQGGHDIYAWLRKNNYPVGFQTLCYNCNCVKAQIGEKALLHYLSISSEESPSSPPPTAEPVDTSTPSHG